MKDCIKELYKGKKYYKISENHNICNINSNIINLILLASILDLSHPA